MQFVWDKYIRVDTSNMEQYVTGCNLDSTDTYLLASTTDNCDVALVITAATGAIHRAYQPKGSGAAACNEDRYIATTLHYFDPYLYI